jgi:hypothetical protein
MAKRELLEHLSDFLGSDAMDIANGLERDAVVGGGSGASVWLD